MNRIITLVLIGLSLLLFSGVAVADHGDEGDEIKNLTEDSITKEDAGRLYISPRGGMKINPGIAIEGLWTNLGMNFDSVDFERHYTGDGPFDTEPVPTRVEWEIWVDGERVKDLGGVFYPENRESTWWLSEQSGLRDAHRVPIPEQTDGDVNITVTGATFDRTMILETRPQFESPRTVTVGTSKTNDLEILGAVTSPRYLWEDRYEQFDQGSDDMAYGSDIFHWVWFKNAEGEKIDMRRFDDGSSWFNFVADSQTSYYECGMNLAQTNGDVCDDPVLVPTDELILEQGETFYKREGEFSFGDGLGDHAPPGQVTWRFKEGLQRDYTQNLSFISNDGITVHEPTLDEIEVLTDQVTRDSEAEIKIYWKEDAEIWSGFAEIWVDGEFQKYVRGTDEESPQSPTGQNRATHTMTVDIPSSDQVTIEARLDGSSASTTIDLNSEDDLESPEETDSVEIDIESTENIVVGDVDGQVIIDITQIEGQSDIERSMTIDDETVIKNLTDGTYNITAIGDNNITTTTEDQTDDPPDNTDDPPDDSGDNPDDSEDDNPPVGPPSGSSDGAGPGFGIPMIVGVIFLLSVVVIRR